MNSHASRSRFLAPLATLAAVCSFVTAAQAATITWGTATNISGNSDVSTTGTLFYSGNVGNSSGTSAGTWSAGATTTINGVVFTSAFSNTLREVNNVDSTLASWTPKSATSGAAAITTFGTINTTFGGGTGFSGLSAEYQSLLGDGAYSGTGVSVTLTFNNLTSGKDYQFQWWTSDSRSGSIGRTVTATAGNGVTISSNTASSGSNGLGQYVIGTFTANGTNSQSIVFTGSAGVQLSGFQLRDISAVPEPSTYAAFAGLGALGLAALRRRPRQA